MKKIILTIALIVVALLIYSLLTSENINSLEGDFHELAFKRNENNTGPIHRVYAYALRDTLWSEMKKHAPLLPHTKYGTTEVYYFLSDEFSYTNLKLDMRGINHEVQSYCIGYAKIDGQSRFQFIRFPYKP